MTIAMMLRRFFEPGVGRVSIAHRLATCTNTTFTKSFRQGDAIEVCGQTAEIEEVVDDTTLVITKPWYGTVTGYPYCRIAHDLFINTDAGLLVFTPYLNDFTVSLVLVDGDGVERRELHGDEREAAIDVTRDYFADSRPVEEEVAATA
jgi:hypothetical protein